MSRVEKLIPGAMMLSARQNPQNRNQKKFAFTSMENSWNPISNRKDHDHAHDHGDEELCCVPVRRPPGTGRQHAGDQSDEDAYGRIRIFLQKKERMFATPRNPMTPPMNTGISGGTWLLKFLNGWDRSSMIGL